MTSPRTLSPDRKGIFSALGAGLLFGLSNPLSKLMLAQVDAWTMAGLLYLGAGAGLGIYRLLRRLPAVRFEAKDRLHLLMAIAFGGGLAPVLLMVGLKGMAASTASLLLNAELVFTVLLAWGVFREPLGGRVVVGIAAIFAGALAVSWRGPAGTGALWPTLAVLGACLAWAIDNNLTRKISLTDATWIASVKGLAAGGANLLLAYLGTGSVWPRPGYLLAGLLLGLLAYGLSLVLFVVGLRHLGAARAGAYFSTAPFFGAVLAVALGDPLTIRLLLTGGLMGLGVWLSMTESHGDEHAHEAMEHAHRHVHDEHHAHGGCAAGTHIHRHRHEPFVHSHVHFPDLHHRHQH